MLKVRCLYSNRKKIKKNAIFLLKYCLKCLLINNIFVPLQANSKLKNIILKEI